MSVLDRSVVVGGAEIADFDDGNEVGGTEEGHTDTGQGGGNGLSPSTMIGQSALRYYLDTYIKKQTNKRSASVNPVLILKIAPC